jgi:hypothetical protein
MLPRQPHVKKEDMECGFRANAPFAEILSAVTPLVLRFMSEDNCREALYFHLMWS